jgi:heme/copper-type cytochrome/quinol oxidase subunit 3
MASLIQQRMAIDRSRHWALAMIVFGVCIVAVGVMDWEHAGQSPLEYSRMLFSVAFLAVGVYRLGRARRAMASFEAQHGDGAGKQEPVR